MEITFILPEGDLHIMTIDQCKSVRDTIEQLREEGVLTEGAFMLQYSDGILLEHQKIGKLEDILEEPLRVVPMPQRLQEKYQPENIKAPRWLCPEPPGKLPVNPKLTAEEEQNTENLNQAMDFLASIPQPIAFEGIFSEVGQPQQVLQRIQLLALILSSDNQPYDLPTEPLHIQRAFTTQEQLNEAISTIVDCGFSPDEAHRALERADGVLSQAISFLFPE